MGSLVPGWDNSEEDFQEIGAPAIPTAACKGVRSGYALRGARPGAKMHTVTLMNLTDVKLSPVYCLLGLVVSKARSGR